ncbi:F-box/RNI/FBD-like domain protein [Trifolium medium]|uniref:F-box/RNI/FBD-like domain protein n=1 Tax=Trifolium medium TaxID=97028 RepID=A0A392NFJ9_9FABA|nr:F-box/RNI/FBD-like domain protein [Trifolium medium]
MELSLAFSSLSELRILSPIDIVTKWVNFAVQRGVQYIDLYVGNRSKLPISILTCTTLVVLKIDNFIMEKGFPPVTLPSLKTLHLNNISFPQHRDFMLFIAGCPILENLLTFDVLFDSVVSLTCEEWENFSLPNLTTANIDGCRNQYREHFPLKVVHNVSSLRLEIGQDYLGDFIPTFHNLTKLDFVCSSLNNNWELVVEVLKHCPKLQKLRLSEFVR